MIPSIIQRLVKYREQYESLPTFDPKISFLDALQIIQKGGVGRPLLSQEIEAFYVIHSKFNRPGSAKWIISLRGGPPIPGTPESLPIWQQNHTREFVDATSGKWLGACNFP
jgi:hypothetical protein